MNIEVSRRGLLKVAGAGAAGTALGALGFAAAEAATAAHVRAFKLASDDGDPQHLPLLLGRLRRHHLFQGRPAEGRDAPRSPTSKATPTIRPIAARSARRARR